MRKIFSVVLVLFFSAVFVHGQRFRGDRVIAFYNLENLFDTINTPEIRDGEFTPEGSKKWNAEKYEQKLNNISKVILGISGAEGKKGGPSVIGLCEVENEDVLRDLINRTPLGKSGYSIVHHQSPDWRGIDVALLYREKHFVPDTSVSQPVYLFDPVTGRRIATRDQLLVSGYLDGEKIFFIVNHWPSRWGGAMYSQPMRIAAAQVCRHIVDSVQKVDSLAKIIIMGDLNDDPDNLSVKYYLNACGTPDSLKAGQLYNCTYSIFKEGTGSLKYKGVWNLFDQFIVSSELLNSSKGFRVKKTEVFKPGYLIEQEGDYKGYPLRTYAGKKHLGGFSDHLPTYIVLTKD